jgi:hypothetical protein
MNPVALKRFFIEAFSFHFSLAKGATTSHLHPTIDAVFERKVGLEVGRVPTVRMPEASE